GKGHSWPNRYQQRYWCEGVSRGYEAGGRFDRDFRRSSAWRDGVGPDVERSTGESVRGDRQDSLRRDAFSEGYRDGESSGGCGRLAAFPVSRSTEFSRRIALD